MALEREREFAEMHAQYDGMMDALSEWAEQKHAVFSAGTESIEPAELAARLDGHVRYGHEERPAKIQQMMEVEALYHSINSRMAALGRAFAPTEGRTLASMHRWWERLNQAEQAYEEGIKKSLRGVKKLGRLVKLFNSKTTKIETWLATKAAWLQCAHDVATNELGKERVDVAGAALPASASRQASVPASPSRQASAQAGADERLTDPTAAPMAPLAAGADASTTPPPAPLAPAPLAPDVLFEGATPTPSDAPTEATPKEAPEAPEDEGGEESGGNKRPSLFGDFFEAIQQHMTPRGPNSSDNLASMETDAPANGAGANGEGTDASAEAIGTTLDAQIHDAVADVPAPTKADSDGPFKSPVVRGRRASAKFAEELRSEVSRQASGANMALDSVSAVLAKMNNFKAFEEEQANRGHSVSGVQVIIEELRTLHCPVIDKIEKRFEDCSEGFEALTLAAAAYKADLEECLAKHKGLDEQRLAFARRAEALNRWAEEGIDGQNEPVEADSMAEADAAEAESCAFLAELDERHAELASLKALQEEMDEAGAGNNPYSRFSVGEIESLLLAALAAYDERVNAIASARARIAVFDEQKKEFASLAEEVLAFAKKEKDDLEAQEKAIGTIFPDDPESIVRAKEALAAFNDYAGKAPERSAVLAPAKKVSDSLFAAAEMDNPYTRQSMASLTSAIDQLEKLVRDAINLVEGQLARATASISPGQHAELKEAFTHFDKTGDGVLNKLEYVAAMKSLDFEGEATDAEFVKFAKAVTGKGWDGEDKIEKCIDFDAFLTIVLQQYKSKDTVDGLLAAFRALTNGKDAVQPDELQKSLKPADAEFLTSRLTAGADGLDFVPFSKAVYGDGEIAPASVS